MSYRVILVDDHELVRSGLRRAFELAEDFDVVGESGTLKDARHRVAALRPDVCTIDLSLPDGDGLTLIDELRRAFPGLGIVALTMHAGDDYLFASLDAGANAFLPKSSPLADVVTAARQSAANPRTFYATDLAAALRRREATVASQAPDLSPREVEVLELLAKGLGTTQVARRLGVAPSTAKTHVTRLYAKLGAGNRAQAIMAGVRAGLLDSE